MDSMRPHFVLYMGEEHPHAVVFQNKDGSWGREGEVEALLGIGKGKGKENGQGYFAEDEVNEQLKMEAAYYEEKYEICHKAVVYQLADLRDMHKQAALRLDKALFRVKDFAPDDVAGTSSPTRRVVVEVSEDGPSMNDGGVPIGNVKRTPYTRSRAANAGKRGRGRKA